MKVLHIVPTYLPAVRYGGPIYSVHGLASAQARLGHDVHVFTTDVDGTSNSPVPLCAPVEMDRVRVTYFPSRFLRRIYWAPRMGEALEQSAASFDVIHLHSVFLWPTVAGARAALKAGVPYVLSPRGMLVSRLIAQRGRVRKQLWIRLFEQGHLARAAGVHVTSEREGEELSKLGLRVSRLWVVPNGVDRNTCDDRHPHREHDAILFVGRLSWEKALDRLICAVAQVEACRLWIVGASEGNALPLLEALARRLGVSERVTFLGPKYGPDKTRLYQRATVLVLPSMSESFGNVALEAMGEGCPVIVTPETGIARVVKERGTGLVATNDPDSLAGAIRTLVEHPAARLRMGEAGRVLVARDYNWEVIAQRMEHHYRSAIVREDQAAC